MPAAANFASGTNGTPTARGVVTAGLAPNHMTILGTMVAAGARLIMVMASGAPTGVPKPSGRPSTSLVTPALGAG